MRLVVSTMAIVSALGLLFVGGSDPSRATTIVLTGPAFIKGDARVRGYSREALSWSAFPLATTRGDIGFAGLVNGLRQQYLWLADGTDASLFRVSLSGAAKRFPLVAEIHGKSAAFRPTAIAAAPGDEVTLGGTADGFPGGYLTSVSAGASLSLVTIPSGDIPTSVLALPDKSVWFAGSAHYGAVDVSGKVREYTYPGKISVIYANLAMGADGNVWIAATGSQFTLLGRISPASGVLNEVAVSGGPWAAFLSIVSGFDGAIYLSCETFNATPFITKVDIASGKSTPYPVGNNPSTGLAAAPNSMLWYATATTLIGFSTLTHQVTKYSPPKAQSSLSAVAIDLHGSIWAAGNAEGARHSDIVRLIR